ncbi:MAG: mandelate racemase/muconate lactonizing enzyme family protein, partial [Mycobacteriales bacterium]
IWIDLFRRFTYLGNRGLVTSLISGIDIALWDLKGKALGRPIHDLLGGSVRESVALYTHADAVSWDLVIENVLMMIERGYSAFKFDPFTEMHRHHTAYLGGEISRAGVRVGAESIEAMRRAVGSAIELLIDFHGSYNLASGLRCIRALEPYDITWFEEPFPPENVSALRQLRAQTGAPLCVGERLHTRWDFVELLHEGLVNYVMPDVCWTGGITELKKIATLAEAHAVPIAPHGAHGPIQAVAGAHVMVGVPNFYRLELLGSAWLRLYDACIAPPLDIRRGELFLSDRPGLGVEFDMEYVRANSRADWV